MAAGVLGSVKIGAARRVPAAALAEFVAAADGGACGMTGRRRSHGEGSVFQRASDGRWVGRVDVGHADGKRKRVTVYGKTEREVLGKLREVVKAKERGQDFTTRRRTVAEWLTEWLDDVKATDGTRPQTVRWYRWLVEQHVSPTIGGVKLDRLAPADVRHLLAELVRADVGTVTIRKAHGLLRNALGDAERLELVPRNVARSVRPPAPPQRTVRALTPEEARRLLATARGRAAVPAARPGDHDRPPPWRAAGAAVAGRQLP